MNNKTIIKIVLKGIAACYGILGVGMIVGGILFIVFIAIENLGYTISSLILISFLIPSFFMLLVAYQNLRKFGENSIRSLSAIIAFTFLVLVQRWFEPLSKIFMSEIRSKHYYFLIIFIPFIIAFIIYSTLNRKLIKLTKDEKIATSQTAQGDYENTAEPES